LHPRTDRDSFFRVKLSLNTLSCPSWDLATIFDTAAANQIQGIDFRGVGAEIDVTRMAAFNAELPATLAELRRRGLSMPCLNTSVTLVSPDSQRWNDMLEEFRRYAELGGKCGTQFIRVFGGGIPKELTRDEARTMASRHLRQLIKIGKIFHIIPVLETHDDWRLHEQVLSLMGDLDPAEVGVLWDIEHPFLRGEPVETTAGQLAKYLRHVQVKDSVEHEGRRLPKLLGQGELPIVPALKALKVNGYDGWLALETEKRWHAAGPEPEIGVPQFARYIREALDHIR
jgi:sugar phosphate isomerase/epimerase